MKGLRTTIALLLLTTTALAQKPTIKGNVFGGGRMADVKNTVGHTNSTADAATNTCTIDIYKGTIEGNVFGGNDITGDVRQPRYNADGSYNANATNEREGDNSAVVNIHNTCGEKTKISEVYGGGNGYYTYCFTYYPLGQSSGSYDYVINADALATNPNLRWLFTQKSPDGGLEVKVYAPDETNFTGTPVATYTVPKGASLTNVIPIAHNARVLVGDDVLADNAQDKILVGEVYGGAKMAWLSGEGGVTINSGTIGKAFAGNNYGGVVQTTSLTINGTKKPATEPTSADFASFDWSKVGAWDDAESNGFGIGEAYGGGNAVDVLSEAKVKVTGGYVGNLFGGNNLADMAGVPNVLLKGGKIHTVYGGGNAGGMKGVEGFLLGMGTYLNKSLIDNWTELKQTTGYGDGFQMNRFPAFMSTIVSLDASDLFVGNVYGGCRAADVDYSSYIRITNAAYVGDVYGGCDMAGAVGVGPMNDDASRTNYKAPRDLKCKVFDYTNHVDVLAEDYTFPSEPKTGANYTVKAGVPMYYAGTYVTMTGGTVNGKIFGGGNGEYTYTANGDDWSVKGVGSEKILATIPQSKGKPWVVGANVIIEGGTINNNVYLGGNAAPVGKDYTKETSKPTFYGTQVTDYLAMPSYLLIGHTVRTQTDTNPIQINNDVYCGGRKADVYSVVDALIKNNVEINRFFAGNDISGHVKGNNRTSFPYYPQASAGAETATTHLLGETNSLSGAPITDIAYVRVEGAGKDVLQIEHPAAKITTLFGGGNGDYNYAAGGEYAGLEKPYQESTYLDVVGNVITAYGGGNAADIDNTHVCIYGPAVVGTTEVAGAVYGGCKSANVTHAANVTMLGDGTNSPTVYGNVFGGCDISGNVGNCALACTDEHGTKNENVHLSDDVPADATKADHSFVKILGGTVTNRVFGGGNGLQSADGTAYYEGIPVSTGTAPFDVFTYPEGSTYAGKQLPVCQNTYVLVQNATIGTTESTLGNEVHTCFAGGQGVGTKVMHNAYTLLGTTSQTDNTLVNGILYGGSLAGFVNSSCEDITKTTLLGYGTTTSVKGDIYGGSFGNHVRGEISLNINNISIGATNSSSAGIYAGNNNAGQPECEASINYVGNDCNVALYGGGNMAPFYGTTRITFTKGSLGYIYGGGNHAPVYGNTIVEVLGGHVCHDVFGGGNEGGVFKWKNSAEHPTPNGEDYGGNTLVIVRDDCLQTDASGNLVEDAITSNYSANRGTTSYFNTNEDGTEMTTPVDPYTADKQLYILKPNGDTPEGCKKSTIQIDGNVFGGGNAADVEGKATVIIGNKTL